MHDTLAVFAAKSDMNNMSAARLIGVFQPSLLSRPPAQMDAEEYAIAADTLLFMIKSSDELVRR